MSPESREQRAESPEPGCWTCRTRSASGDGPCSVHNGESPEPKVVVGETTYTARRSITIEGADESADTYRRALEAARAAGIPDDARMNAFSSSRSATFSFHWIVADVPR